MPDHRVTFRTRHSYATKSNKQKKVRTPGGRIVMQTRTKVANGVRCGDCKATLAGIEHLRPRAYARLSKRQKTVSRAYGGNLCACCVKERFVLFILLFCFLIIFSYFRIVRAFLIEEQKIVKKVLKVILLLFRISLFISALFLFFYFFFFLFYYFSFSFCRHKKLKENNKYRFFSSSALLFKKVHFKINYSINVQKQRNCEFVNLLLK
jgi:large subunit ribosomal protein L34e